MKPSLATLLLVSLPMLSACAHGEQLHSPMSTGRSTTATRATSTRPILDDHRAVSAVAWESAGRRAVRAGLAVAPSFRELIRFPADEPHAVAYHFPLQRGQSLRVRIEPVAGADPLVTELFEVVAADMFRPAPYAHADVLEFTARADANYVLRLQPPLGSSGLYDVTVLADRALLFPVSGANSAAIGSWFGDARSGGTRGHEGVDIFAPRGTPVLAVADGHVTSTQATPAGGKVVWIEDTAGGLTYYFAHLDEQWVREGMWVSTGDTIGTVGNTGNARDTSPHLHFSIYLPGRTPVDPALMLEGGTHVAAPLSDPAMLGRWTRVSGSRVRLRNSPGLAGAILAELRADTPLFVLGGVNDWHRVVLSDGTSGFVAARYTELSQAGRR